MVFMVLAVVASAVTQCTGGSLTLRRVDLKVLVLLDATNTNVVAIRDQLKIEGVPYREVNLADAARPVINAAFLSSASGTNPVIERALYQAVVVPNELIPQLTQAERDALFVFEAKFGVRQIDAYTGATPSVGLNFATNPGFIGVVDGSVAAVTPAGLVSPFNYLAGPVPFADAGSYAYLATPLATPAAGTTYTPLVTMPIPGTTSAGSIIGVLAHDGREELVVVAAFNSAQAQFRALGHGLVEWMTKGVHLGHNRNYFTVHVDDLFAGDARWNAASHCTPGEDCPAGVVAGPDVRMTPADVTAVVAWQNANTYKFEFAWNGVGSIDHQDATTGVDPLLTAIKANVGAFNYLNHTYTHQFLGCVQDYTVVPWKCKTTATGAIQYLDQASIQGEVTLNKTFATTNGLPFDATELLTGEHSGLFILPQQPVDNPNLAPALTATGIKTTGSDASRDFNQRFVGNQTATRTVPRYPLAVFYNVGTKAEEISEYNWIFTAAPTGSGICSSNPATMTCLTPINATTGFDDFIVPLDTTIGLRHILGNDPRPHYAHQSNFSEDRILLTLTQSILTKYRAMFAANSPVTTVRQTQAADVLTLQKAWATGSTQVEAYQLGSDVYVVANGYSGKVPITVPEGTTVASSTGALFGDAYAGQRSAWTAVQATGPIKLVLP